jgi:hypothetical protein
MKTIPQLAFAASKFVFIRAYTSVYVCMCMYVYTHKNKTYHGRVYAYVNIDTCTQAHTSPYVQSRVFCIHTYT